MARLSDTIMNSKRQRDTNRYQGHVVPLQEIDAAPPNAPNPNASPTFSKKFSSMLAATRQPEYYNQTTTQVPSPTAPMEMANQQDPLKEHLSKLGQVQEAKKQKFVGY